MDKSIVVALISAIGSIVSTAVGNLTLSDGTPYHKVKKLFRIRFVLIAILLATIFGGGVWIMVTYFALIPRNTFINNRLLPDSRFEGIASNGSITLNVDPANPLLPASLPRFGAPSDNTDLVKFNDLAFEHTLAYKSDLAGNTSYTICRFISAAVNIEGQTGLRLIIWSKLDDRVELGLKDQYDAEVKPDLELHQGWGVYFVPFARFPDVNLASITEFHIAFTAYLQGPKSNIIRIASIDAY